MALAAKLSIVDVRHQYIVGADAHLESGLVVACRAFEADAMEPVREDNRAHAFLFRPIVEYHIAVFGSGGYRSEQREQGQCACHPRQKSEQVKQVAFENHAVDIEMYVNALGRAML